MLIHSIVPPAASCSELEIVWLSPINLPPTSASGAAIFGADIAGRRADGRVRWCGRGIWFSLMLAMSRRCCRLPPVYGRVELQLASARGGGCVQVKERHVIGAFVCALLLSSWGLYVADQTPFREYSVGLNHLSTQGDYENNILSHLHCEIAKGLIQAKVSNIHWIESKD